MLKNRYAGLTFIEIMIALTINALLLAAVLNIFLANFNHSNLMVKTNRLNQQLQAALDIMTSDIRRAGYWANARNDIGTHQNNNPYMAAGLDISINAGNNCILFAYDHDQSGAIPTISASIDDERYGFRLVNQTLQARPPGATFNCAAATNAWENMTDSSILQITNLSFTMSSQTVTVGPGSKGIMMRNIAISITGQLTSDPTITKTLTQQIRLRNDKFIP